MADMTMWTRAVVVTGIGASILGVLAGMERLTARPLGETAWRTYSDPGGFTMQIPRGWAVRSEPRSFHLEITGHQGERLLLMPLEGAAPVADSGRQLASIAAGLWPEATWKTPEQGSGIPRVLGETQSFRGTCSIVRLSTRDGGRAFVSLATAPVRRARMAEDRFAQTLASLRDSDSETRRVGARAEAAQGTSGS